MSSGPFHRPSFSVSERPSSGRSSGTSHTHTLSQHMNTIHANNDRVPKASIGASSGSTGSPRPSTSSGILQSVTVSIANTIGSSESLNKMDSNGTDKPVTKEMNGSGTSTNPSIGSAPFPYPLSKDLRLIGMDVLDHEFLMQCRKTVTWLDFGTSPPKRSLDLGCGTGAWVIDAAKQWKDCHFVGFDMHNMQPKVQMLPKQIGERIQWVQGNFLEKLPFDDNSFDHIHVFRVAWGVPEGTLDALLAEIERILKPGGALEWVEEDLVFPRIPRSYTTKPKQRPAGHYSRLSQTLEIPPTPVDETASLPHAHVLLESLFFGVFETRMINPRPIMILPHYLNTYFKHVLATSEQSYPFPPPPMPRQSHTRHASMEQRKISQPQLPLQQDPDYLRTPTSQDLSAARPRSQSEASQLSQMSSLSSMSAATTTTFASSNSFPGEESPGDISLPLQPPYAPTFGLFHPVSGGNSLSIPLLRPIGPIEVNDRLLALYLNTAYIRILACREAMWLELVRRLRRGKEERKELSALGWDEEGDEDVSAYDNGFSGAEMGVSTSGGDASDGDGVEAPPNSVNPGGSTPADQQRQSQLPQPRPSSSLIRARARFEEFLSRFERDMRLRTSLSDAVQQGLKWQKPRPLGPINKYEKAREMEMEGVVAEAIRAEVEARLRGVDALSDAEALRTGSELGSEGAGWAISRRFRGFVGLKAENVVSPARR